MKIPRKINSWRARIMQGLMGRIGSGKRPFQTMNEPLELRKVLISRPNGRLGNLLMTTPLVQEIRAVFPECEIDFFVKGNLTPIIYRNYFNMGRMIILPGKPFKSLGSYIRTWFRIRQKRYDLVINVAENSSSGRLSTGLARARFSIFGETDATTAADAIHMAKKPVYAFRDFLKHFGISRPTEIPPMDLKLDASELAHGKRKLAELVDASKPTITIFTFATGTKMHAADWWEAFYAALKEKYPDYNILEMLPKENVSQIGFEAPSFCGHDIREMAAIMANTAVFIGADSGIMHLASAARVTTVGLFAVTSTVKYTPYANGSTAIDTTTTSLEQILGIIDGILTRRQEKP